MARESDLKCLHYSQNIMALKKKKNGELSITLIMIVKKKFSHMLDYHVSSRGVEPKLNLIIEPIEGAFTEGFTFEKITKELIL